VIGLIIGAGMYVWTSLPIEPQTTTSFSQLVLAGVLVGFGARMGNGCTSGHGVCGIARLSPRSVMATAVFLTTAALTVFISRHMGGV
jgi:uncharacterized membrane protein YedE/YeeE